MMTLEDLEAVVSDLRNQKDPDSFRGKLDFVQTELESLRAEVLSIKKQLDIVTEYFSPEQIVELFNTSGYTTVDLEGYFAQVGAAFTKPQVAKIVSGNISTLSIPAISALGKYLRKGVAKRV